MSNPSDDSDAFYTTWGAVGVGDVVIANGGERWSVLAAESTVANHRKITIALPGVDPLTRSVPTGKSVKLAARNVPIRDALEALAQTFEGATVDAHALPKHIVCEQCGAIVAASHESRHVGWHRDAPDMFILDIAGRLSELERTLSDAEVGVREHES